MLIEDELEDLGATKIKVTVNEKKQEATVNCDIDIPKKKVIAAINALGDYKAA